MAIASSTGQPREDGPSRHQPAGWCRRFGPYGLPVLAAIAALAVSWQSWIDPFVDSGREMDVPWRLLQGERLYGDITYYYGPLGPWVNALALRLFGNAWLSLELVCAALSALIFLLLFRLTRRAGGLLSAATATTLAAAVCMAAPRGGAFVFPYSSSSLFALAGGLLALDAAAAPGPRRRRLLCALGIAIALASRLEIGAAAAMAMVLAGIRSRHREETRADLQAVALGALVAGGIYGAALAGIPASSQISDGPFGPFLGMPKEWGFLYRKISGVEQPGNAASRMEVSLLLDGLLLAAAAWWALPRTDRPARRHRFAIAGLMLFTAYLLSPWCATAKNLPPLLAILPPVALAAALALLRRPLDERARSQFLLFFFSAAVAARVFFGIEVGPRMGPNAALPMPGLLATAAVLAFDLLAPRLPAPEVFRRRLAAVLAVAGVLFLYRIQRLDHRPQMAELRTAAGALRLPAVKAAAIARTLGYLEGRAREGDTLTAFPESGFFNFVTGLRSPLRQDLIVPGVLSGSRETAAVRRIDDAGPKYILLCNRATAEFGPASFGRDYAVELWDDVGRRYVLAAAFGPAAPAAPVGAKDFFIRLYQRSPAANAPVQLASTGLRRQPTAWFPSSR
jgi:4-amino-4-deoxy-L-arabinose transferase-like glycosyltransferase